MLIFWWRECFRLNAICWILLTPRLVSALWAVNKTQQYKISVAVVCDAFQRTMCDQTMTKSEQSSPHCPVSCLFIVLTCLWDITSNFWGVIYGDRKGKTASAGVSKSASVAWHLCNFVLKWKRMAALFSCRFVSGGIALCAPWIGAPR